MHVAAFPNDNFAEISRETIGRGALGLSLPNRHLATGVTRLAASRLSATDTAGRDHVATVVASAGSVRRCSCDVTAQGLTTG